jgi:hypothetical protein
LEVLAQGGFAPLMYDASGGPNLGIVVGCNIFHQKVHQPPPLLKQGKEAYDLSFGLITG